MFSMFQSMKKQRNMPDFILLALILTLLVIGLMMVYSSSHVWADYKYGDPFFFLKRQLLFVSIGLLFMFVLTFVSYKIWKKYVMVILTLCFLFLVLVLVPGIGIVRGGAQSWIGIGAFSIQPSEFMKLGLIMFLAYYLEKHRFHIHTFKKGFFVPISLVFISFACIMLQPDLGTGVVLVITAVLMIFIAGSHLRYFIWLSILGLFGFVLLILS